MKSGMETDRHRVPLLLAHSLSACCWAKITLSGGWERRRA